MNNCKQLPAYLHQEVYTHEFKHLSVAIVPPKRRAALAVTANTEWIVDGAERVWCCHHSCHTCTLTTPNGEGIKQHRRKLSNCHWIYGPDWRMCTGPDIPRGLWK
jgi:hypothetical protein